MLAWGIGRLADNASESTKAKETESQTSAMTTINMTFEVHTSYQEVFRVTGGWVCPAAGRDKDNLSQNMTFRHSFRSFGVNRRINGVISETHSTT